MRIGIVDGRAGIAERLKRAVGVEPANRVVWIAHTGVEAQEFCDRDTPDLILMDMTTSGIDGVETTRRIMSRTPCAILLITGCGELTARPIFEAMGHGALDAVESPSACAGKMDEHALLRAKIALISRIVTDRRGRRSRRAGEADFATPPRLDRLIAIGASAGGPAALAMLLRDLPEDFPAAIVIVQHVDEQFAAGMAAWLNFGTALHVRVAAEGDRPMPGEVLLAGTSDHLTLKTAERLGYISDPIDYVYRPSVDVFFLSACRLRPGEVVGVLLTGMGRDGALGLKALRDRGHYTIAQDEATSAVYGMPKAAAQIDAAVDILPAGRIGSKLMEVLLCGRP